MLKNMSYRLSVGVMKCCQITTLSDFGGDLRKQKVILYDEEHKSAGTYLEVHLMQHVYSMLSDQVMYRRLGRFHVHHIRRHSGYIM